MLSLIFVDLDNIHQQLPCRLHIEYVHVFLLFLKLLGIEDILQSNALLLLPFANHFHMFLSIRLCSFFSLSLNFDYILFRLLCLHSFIFCTTHRQAMRKNQGWHKHLYHLRQPSLTSCLGCVSIGSYHIMYFYAIWCRINGANNYNCFEHTYPLIIL